MEYALGCFGRPLLDASPTKNGVADLGCGDSGGHFFIDTTCVVSYNTHFILFRGLFRDLIIRY